MNIKKIIREEVQKIFESRKLNVKQKKILDTWFNENKTKIMNSPGNAFFDFGGKSIDFFPDRLYSKLEDINDFETLYQEINNYLQKKIEEEDSLDELMLVRTDTTPLPNTEDSENKNDFRKNSPMYFKSKKLKNEQTNKQELILKFKKLDNKLYNNDKWDSYIEDEFNKEDVDLTKGDSFEEYIKKAGIDSAENIIRYGENLLKNKNLKESKTTDTAMKPNKKTEDDKTIEKIRKDRIQPKQKQTLTDDVVDKIGKKLNIDWHKFSRKQFKKGMKVEHEHDDITHGDLLLTAKIVLAHLKEIPTYYDALENMEKKLDSKKIETKRKLSDSPVIKECLDRINQLSNIKK